MWGNRREARAGAATLAVALALVALPASVAGQETSDCLACHGEKDFTTERKGRTVSLHVPKKAYAASVHDSLACISCHTDGEGMEGGHEAPLKNVDCAACHEAETKQHEASLHGRAMKRGDSLAPTCAACHGIRDIRAAKDPVSPVSPLKVP